MTDPTRPTPTPEHDSPLLLPAIVYTDEEAQRLIAAIRTAPRPPYLIVAAVLLAVLAGVAGLIRALRLRAVRR